MAVYSFDEYKKKKKNNQTDVAPVSNYKTIEQLANEKGVQISPKSFTNIRDKDVDALSPTKNDDRNWLEKTGDFFGAYGMAGITGINDFLFKTIQMFNPWRDDEDNPITKVANFYIESNKEQVEKAENVSKNLTDNEIVNDVLDKVGKYAIQGTITALPQAAMAVMSGGASLGAMAGSASQVALEHTISNTIINVAKNPAFWGSFVQMTGTSYYDAKEEGASDLEASTVATLNGLLGSIVEIGGGLEELPQLQRGIKAWVSTMFDEGKEEVVQGAIEGVLKKGIYDNDKKVFAVDDDEAVVSLKRGLEEFIGGAVVGGILGVGEMGASSVIEHKKEGRSLRTNLTENETKVYESEVNRIIDYYKSQTGNEITSREKRKLKREILQKVKDGDVSIDTIRKALGENVDISKDYYLQESFKQEYLRGEAYSYKKTDNQAENDIRESARTSGMNNTRKTQNLVDFVTKVATEKGMKVRFANSGQIENMGKAKYIKDKNGNELYVDKDGNKYWYNKKTNKFMDENYNTVEVDKNELKNYLITNGFVDTDGTIYINPNSSHPLEAILGHEVNHTLEGAKGFNELQNMIVDYVKGKKLYEPLMVDIRENYKGMSEDEQHIELSGDVIGQVLFTDDDFIKNLSAKQPNIFKRIYEEVKHFCKLATAGSSEARQLEKIRYKFSKVYREMNQNVEKAEGEAVEYSVSKDSEGTELTKEQQEYFKDSKVRDENGNLLVMWHGTERGGFTVFDSSFSDDSSSFFFTDNKGVAKSYSGDSYEYAPMEYKTLKELQDFVSTTYSDVVFTEEDGKIIATEYGDIEGTFDTIKEAYDWWTDYEMFEPDFANYKSYLNLKNPLIVDAKGSQWNEINFNGMTNANTRQVSTYARKNGYDGVILKNLIDLGGYGFPRSKDSRSTVAIAFESNQIKSVANTTPTEDADIRYSVSTDTLRDKTPGNYTFENDLVKANFEAQDSESRYSVSTYREQDYKYVMPISTSAKVKFARIDGKKAQGKKTPMYTGREIIEWALEGNEHKAEILKTLDDMADFMVDQEVKFTFIGLDDVNNAKIKKGADGKIVISAMTKNGEYPVNFDFTQICKKREALMEFIDELCKREGKLGGDKMIEEVSLSKSNIFKINKILKDYGYETQCLGCFVEAKRFNIKEWAESFAEKWNQVVEQINPNADYFNFTDGTKDAESLTSDEISQIEDTLKKYNLDKKGKTKIKAKEMNAEINKIKKNGLTQEYFDKMTNSRDPEWKYYDENHRVSLKKQQYFESATSLSDKDIKYLKDKKIIGGSNLNNLEKIETLVASGEIFQKKLKVSDLITPQGIAEIKALSTEMAGILSGHYGSGTPKFAQGFAPYNNEIEFLPQKVGNKTLAQYLESIGGLRTQSFSDFKIQNVFDYLQMVAGLTARDLPAHAYTKEIAFAELFGKCGMKINLSVMFDIDMTYNGKTYTNLEEMLKEIPEEEVQILKDHAGLSRVPKNLSAEARKQIEKTYGIYKDEYGEWMYVIGDQERSDMVYEQNVKDLMEKGMSEKDARENAQRPFVQSIGFRQAVELQNREGYTSNIGIIGVGYSKSHILMMLQDGNIRYIIPYHSSGLPSEIKEATHIEMATDYTNVQNTLYATVYDQNKNEVEYDLAGALKKNKGDVKKTYNEYMKWIEDNGYRLETSKAEAGHGDFKLYETLKKNDNNPYKTADDYIAYCFKKGYLPLFYEFCTDPNYYKLLYDFNVVDNVTGEFAPQGNVTWNFPENFKQRVTDYMQEQNDYKQAQSSKFEEALNDIYKATNLNNSKKALELPSYSVSRNITPISDSDYKTMESFFGTTKNYNVAGYLLTDGNMLDFSGKHWGDDYSTTRQVDHRDIWDATEPSDMGGTDAMVNMIGNGNIRLMPENGGINLAVMPTAEQLKTLRGYINHFRGEILVDIDSVGGDTIQSFEYNKGTSSSKIISDLRNYFENGTIPQQSELGKYRYSVSKSKAMIPDLAPLNTRKTTGEDVMRVDRREELPFSDAPLSIDELADNYYKGNIEAPEDIEEDYAPYQNAMKLSDAEALQGDLQERANQDALEYNEEDYEETTESDIKYNAPALVFPVQGKVANVVERKPQDKKKGGFGSLVQALVNKGHWVDKFAKATGNKRLTYLYDKMLSVQGEGHHDIGVAQSDNEGNIIGKSINDIWKPVEDAKLMTPFQDYLLHLHNIDRYREGKPVFGYQITDQMSQNAVEDYDKKYPQFKAWAKDINTYNRNQLSNMVDAQITSADVEQLLNDTYSNYVRIHRDIKNKGNAVISTYNGTIKLKSPIKKAKGGNQDIFSLKDSMALQTLEVKNAIRRNQLALEIYNTLKANKRLNIIKDGNKKLISKSDSGIYSMTAFVDGNPVEFEITEELYNSLSNDDKYKLKDLEERLGSITTPIQKLSAFQRNLLTVNNPIFIATNFFKDIGDAPFNSKYAKTFYKNYVRAAKEIMTNGDFYKKYLALGGEQNTYFDYDKGFKKEKGKYNFIENIAKVNEAIEMMPRLAEFISTLEAGGDIMEAMYNAAEITTNFKRGGDITKAINRNGVNFLNASVQGLSKQIRNVTDAKGFKGYVNLITKACLFGVLPSLLNNLLLGDDEDYEELSDYVKDSYFVFKTGDGEFIRIPKGRVMAVMGAAARRTIERIGGDEDAYNGLGQLAINNVAPNNPLTDNLLAPFLQVASNTTWYGGDLVPTRLQDELPKNQYDESTDSISKFIGKALGISPIKVNYIIDQYSGGIGDVFLPMITPEATSGSDSIIGKALAPAIDKFTANSTFDNKYSSEFYSKVSELTAIANDSESTEEDKLKAKYMSEVSSEVGKLYAQIREVQNSDLINSEKYKEVSDIRNEINELTKYAMENYERVSINSNYATVGDKSYRNNNGTWSKISDEQKQKQNEAMSKYGISASTYWSNTEEYNYALANPETYEVAKAIDTYQGYKTYREAIGNISGKDRKSQIINYVSSLDLSLPQKAMLIRTEYKSFNDYNTEIVRYVNTLNVSDETKIMILEKQGFKVNNGRVSW